MIQISGIANYYQPISQNNDFCCELNVEIEVLVGHCMHVLKFHSKKQICYLNWVKLALNGPICSKCAVMSVYGRKVPSISMDLS